MWNKLDRERQILQDLIYMWNLNKKKKPKETENRLLVARKMGKQVGEIGKIN